MKLRRSTAKALAALAVFVLLAASCGGGSDESATVADPAGEQDAAPGEVTGPIATTAPLTVPAETPATETVDEPVEGAGAGLPPVDPNEVTILHVNDDVQIVPVFDGPNGNNITLYDRNELESPAVEIEYPLYAETSFGNRLALLVEEYDDSGAWAKVQMPVRPNNTTAWVQTAFFREEKHTYRIEIVLSENKVYVFDGDTEIIQGGQLAVSGRESRPTPVVRSYIDEKIPGATLSPAYGDWVLSIAAFSEDLSTFGGGGMPKLALHGTNQPELMGQYVSSGCVRIPNEIISFLADTIPIGTIVDIVA